MSLGRSTTHDLMVSLALANHAREEKPEVLSYLEFHKHMQLFSQTSARAKKNIFQNFIQNAGIFKPKSAPKEVQVDWPHRNGTRTILIVVEASAGTHKLYFQDTNNFMSLSFSDSNEMLVELLPPPLVFPEDNVWTEHDIQEIASEFACALGIEKISYQRKSENKEEQYLAFDQQAFSNLIEQYADRNITCRINNIILQNSIRSENTYRFSLSWPHRDGKNSQLNVSFARGNQFKSPTSKRDGFSWIFTEETLLRYFPEYKAYNMPLGQLYYTFQVCEVVETKKKSKKEEIEILSLWMTPDAKFGELREIHKSDTISGNEALRMYAYFEKIFQIGNTFICDESKLVEEDADLDDKNCVRIPLRLIQALATGKTWYESKFKGLSLFECENFQTAYKGNNNATQNIASRNLALRELQNTRLREWRDLLDADRQKLLFQLIKNNLPEFTGKRTRPGDLALESQMEATIKDLCVHVCNNARGKKNISPDLALLVRLLCDGIDLRTKNSDTKLDDTAPDFWIKSRVHELLWGSFFWIRKRLDSNAPQIDKALLNKSF